MPKESPLNNNSETIIEILAIFGACLVIFLIIQSLLYEVPIHKFISLLKKDLYLPHHNTFGIGKFIFINVLAFFYKFLLLTILVAITYFTFFTGQKTNRQYLSLSQIVTTIGIIGLLFLTSVQQIQRFEHFISEKRKVSGKSTDEKIASLFGWKYQFPKICQKMLNEPHQGEFIFDYDISKDPYMFYQRLMSYHLYPKLSMRFDNNSPKDCLFLYLNKSALDKIPENYKIIVTAKNARYILAIRDKEEK